MGKKENGFRDPKALNKKSTVEGRRANI